MDVPPFINIGGHVPCPIDDPEFSATLQLF